MNMQQLLLDLFSTHFATAPSSIEQLTAHASQRQLFRIFSGNRSYIGVINGDLSENRAFIEFTRHFEKHKLPVPHIHAVSSDQQAYIEDDLGEQTLYDLLMSSRTDSQEFPDSVVSYYEKALELLVLFQVKAGKSLNYGLCHPYRDYSYDSILNDLHYFKKRFLGNIQLPVDDEQLEKDFHIFATYLDSADSDFFLYRDFQARNIMVQGQDLYFIDYQGGRRGALQYDVVSLLYQAQAMLPDEIRDHLLDHYLNALVSQIDFDEAIFREYYKGFAYIRLIQVLGAYGKLGLEEKRSYFLNGIPKAIKTISRIYRDAAFPVEADYLQEVIDRLSSYSSEECRCLEN